MTRTASEKALFAVLLFTAVTAMVGGLLFMLEPDGGLLGADPALLAGSPFSDWFWPGMLLGILVGLGFLSVALWQFLWGWGANELAVAAGVGLIAFEVVEFLIIGFHPLQLIYAVIGVVVIVLALKARVSSARRRSQGIRPA